MVVKPFCLGSPTIVSATSSTCRECAHQIGCVGAAIELVCQLPDSPLTKRERQKLGLVRRAFTSSPRGEGEGVAPPRVTASLRGVHRIALTTDEEKRVEALPARVSSQVRQLMQRGWFEFAKEEIRLGRNPGDKGWKKTLCRLLLSGGCTRDELQLAFCDELRMSPASARSQASTAVAVFSFGRLLVEHRGRLKLSSN